MPQDRWGEAKALFQAALEQPPGKRAAFLAAGCPDATLRAEVAKLLGLHDGATDFLESPIGSQHAPVAADPLIGQRFGDFRIVRRIGGGGMGVVYEAQQEQPRRLAAVKVIRPGLATARGLRRFEYESEVLAKLQHPGIASVYAAGTFDLGDGPQPWFAMELVQGSPLSAYVAGQRLSTREKIELLLRICDAVQHAHQRGVVHRDLKPGNILVSDEATERRSDEGKENDPLPSVASSLRRSVASPKVLDFGVARVIGHEALATMHTTAGELVGTLRYMSREQLCGNPEDVDARSDVYALGVIGYEMLAGRLPYDHKSSVADVIRSIDQDEPQRLGVMDKSLRGDIETIFAKALEKDRTRRYQSAGELAADLQRHLNDEPVLARRATVLYQLRKFTRRNRALVGGVLATILALTVGLILYAIEANRARHEAARSRYEAEKATAINDFITNDFLMKLLAAANAADVGQRLPVAQLVDQAAAQVGVMFADRPLAEAAVRNEVGTIYYNLSAFEKAAEQFSRALALWESQLGADHADTLKAVNNLGLTYAHLQRVEEAEALYRRALDGRLRVLGEDDPYTLVTMNNLAELLRSTKRLDEAEAMLRRALAAQQRVHGPAHKNTLTTTANLGTLLLERGQKDEALRLHRQVYEACRDTLGADHVTTLAAGSRLGQTLHRAGAAAEAETLLVAVISAFERTLGAANNNTLTARRALARVYAGAGQRDRAVAELQQALAAARAASDPPDRIIRAIQKELDALATSQPATSAP